MAPLTQTLLTSYAAIVGPLVGAMFLFGVFTRFR